MQLKRNIRATTYEQSDNSLVIGDIVKSYYRLVLDWLSPFIDDFHSIIFYPSRPKNHQGASFSFNTFSSASPSSSSEETGRGREASAAAVANLGAKKKRLGLMKKTDGVKKMNT